MSQDVIGRLYSRQELAELIRLPTCEDEKTHGVPTREGSNRNRTLKIRQSKHPPQHNFMPIPPDL